VQCAVYRPPELSRDTQSVANDNNLFGHQLIHLAAHLEIQKWFDSTTKKPVKFMAAVSADAKVLAIPPNTNDLVCFRPICANNCNEPK
jgi:hypothetical protein